MPEREFNNQLNDSQGTVVEPVKPERFDFEKYVDYEAGLLDRCRQFWQSDGGIAVYRRFRVPEVFSFGCRDMERSLSFQLGGLAASMNYETDIPNFLEPWFGLGTVTSAFGLDYQWPEGQAPAVKATFDSVEQAVSREIIPIEQTNIGKHTLKMIEYFLEKTGGKIPMSFCDTQSPMNTASALVKINNFFMSLVDNPNGLKRLLNIITDLLIGFTKKQAELIGSTLVNPGHGFASSRVFKGLGMSDDVMLLLSPKQCKEFEPPTLTKAGMDFGGVAFHSCGNWSSKIDAVKAIDGVVMVDAAFCQQTDPDPNPMEPFRHEFGNTDIVVNARMVGDANIVVETVKRLYKPSLKLIVVTYCKNPEEQRQVYDRIHKLDNKT